MNYQRQISLKVLVQEMGEAQQRKKFLFQTVLKMGGLHTVRARFTCCPTDDDGEDLVIARHSA